MEKELIEERVKLFEQNKALLDKAAAEKRTLTPEEQQEYDGRDVRITEIRGTLERIEKQASEERSLSASRGRRTDIQVDGPAAADVDLAFRAWACGDSATDEMVAAAQRLNFRHHRRQLEARALSSVTATQGQASIPDEMMRSFWEMQKWFGAVRNLATVLSTTTGAPLPLPTVDDTGNTGEIVADGGAVTTTADPLFGQVVLGAFKYSSKAVIVPVELLQDSSINLPQYLGRALGTRIARKQNTDYTVGTGTTLPFGVQVQASLGKTAAATNAITFDELIDLRSAVDPAYRMQPGAGYMMHDSVATFVRKLKDSQNRYLWEISTIAGQPDRLDGYPVYINNDSASTFATNNRLALFGLFSAYHVREAGGPDFYRADELRILNGQVVFLAFQRADGNLLDTTAVRYLRTA